MLVLTYPLIGNYGIDDRVEESARIQPTGLIVREAALYASHLRSQKTLRDFLAERGVVAIEGVDTRAVTRRIRMSGVMPGAITTSETADEALARLRSFTGYDNINWVDSVTTDHVFDWNVPPGEARHKVVLLDGGVKQNIMRSLEARGCSVRVFPASTPADDLLALGPDGIVLSPRPGRPTPPRCDGRRSREAHRQSAHPRHLPWPPGRGARARRRDVQAALRPPRRRPPVQMTTGKVAHHRPEPRLCCQS